MKEELIRKFVEKLDYSYSYKTVNERQNIINEICEIAGIEQLTIPVVVGRSEQLLALAQYMCHYQNNLDGKTAKDYLQDFLSQ